MSQTEDVERLERQHRRDVIDDWRSAAQAIRDGGARTGKKVLLREARRESTAIIEDAARTQEEFENLLIVWDKEEAIEKDRVDKQELLSGLDQLKDWELSDHRAIIPRPIDHEFWRQILSGNFIDFIHDCPHEIQELTTSRNVIELINKLDDSEKEILYYRAIRYWTPQQIAAFRGQTDRNIRKVYNAMIDDIRSGLFERLQTRYEKNLPLTYNQRVHEGKYSEIRKMELA